MELLLAISWGEQAVFAWPVRATLAAQSCLLWSFKLALLRVQERPLFDASPEISEDNHTSDRRIRTPQRGKCVTLELHYNQENHQVCRAENYHHLDLREKQRATGCNHVEQRNRCIVCRLIDIHDTVCSDVQLQWVRMRHSGNMRSCNISPPQSALDLQFRHMADPQLIRPKQYLRGVAVRPTDGMSVVRIDNFLLEVSYDLDVLTQSAYVAPIPQA
jgi:hypothetical protein